MRTPEQAIASILEHAAPLREVEQASLVDALGRVLARDVFSDVDLPPFRKSAMDGYAVHSADLDDPAGGAELRSIGESRAGHPFTAATVARGECIAIYTGAEVPDECDAVVMVEKTESQGERVRFRDRPAKGQNICNRGEDLSDGALVMRTGRRLSATDLSVLAAVGCEPADVFRRPRVAILTTGDELVSPAERPGTGQIREGNTLHLAALAARAGADVKHLGLVPDRADALDAAFGEALDGSDAVITTGGVSMGKYDLVAEAFRRLGVEEVFHKVAIKPGKPIWFGRRGRTLVFALPGNPVSCLLDHEVFVRPALAKLEGAGPDEWTERSRTGRWMGGTTRTNPRQQNLPVSVVQGSDGVDQLRPLEWSSSADIVGLAEADGMAIVPAEEVLAPEQLVAYRPLR